MAIGIRISLKGIQQTVSRLNAFAQMGADGGKSRTELHRRYGIRAMNWINENFRQGGGLLDDGPWQELSANTIAGRRKKSSQILQDNGILRASFQPVATSTEVRIGSPSKIALFHNEGTTGPYEILPRNKMALSFPVASGGMRVSRQLAQKSARTGAGRLRTGINAVVVKKVMHPGLVARRMLPNENELLPRLIRTTENWLTGLGTTGTISVEDTEE